MADSGEGLLGWEPLANRNGRPCAAGTKALISISEKGVICRQSRTSSLAGFATFLVKGAVSCRMAPLLAERVHTYVAKNGVSTGQYGVVSGLVVMSCRKGVVIGQKKTVFVIRTPSLAGKVSGIARVSSAIDRKGAV